MIMIELKTKYCNSVAFIEKGFYQNNDRVALRAMTSYGETLMTLTVNLPDVDLPANCVCIKDYSENEGVLECLILNNIVAKPIGYVMSGYVKIPVCPLLI